jgi:hypothetical protein
MYRQGGLVPPKAIVWYGSSLSMGLTCAPRSAPAASQQSFTAIKGVVKLYRGPGLAADEMAFKKGAR